MAAASSSVAAIRTSGSSSDNAATFKTTLRSRRMSPQRPGEGLAITPALTPGDCAHDKKGFGPFCNRIGQGSIKWIVRDVFAAGKESHEWPALLCFVIADGAAQHWIFFFNRVDYCTHRR